MQTKNFESPLSYFRIQIITNINKMACATKHVDSQVERKDDRIWNMCSVCGPLDNGLVISRIWLFVAKTALNGAVMRGERQAQRLFESQPESGKYLDSLVHFLETIKWTVSKIVFCGRLLTSGRPLFLLVNAFSFIWICNSGVNGKWLKSELVLEPSPNHQIPLKGLRPQDQGCCRSRQDFWINPS